MLSNVKSIKPLECCSRQMLSLVEKKYHLSARGSKRTAQTKNTNNPPQKKRKKKIQPLGFVYEVIFIPALSEQGFGLTF